MPLTRYQARNEYGLADPDLYQAADKDDPEALLEGVTMAGLVGILRQLGDLAEFAAEMFHDLHEEVMATASRSHGLMARVQQLEAEFPFIEKALLHQTDHSPFFSDKGMEWHPNLQLEHSVVTRGDLPRCVMDSYEECRGPPRLFLLDKFDISGAGACLKRYTDPSFVRLETSSYETSWDDIHREKKSQKAKRRASHWRNGGTPENAISSHAKLHELFLEEHLETHHSDPARVVKLKTRKLDGYSLISKSGESYMEKFLQTCDDNKTGYQIVTPDPKLSAWNMDSARDVVTDISEISMVGSLEKSHKGSRAEVSSPNEQENVVNINLNRSVIQKDIETVPESIYSEVPRTFIPKDSQTNFNGKSGFLQHRSCSEDLTSEADNYVDASATMESETETDDECRPKNRSGDLGGGSHHRYSDMDEDKMEDAPQFSFIHSNGNTPASENGQSSFGKRSTYSYSDTASISIDDQSDGEKISGCLPSSFKSELVDSTCHVTPEANEVSRDFNVQESVSSSNLDGNTSFNLNDTCSSPRLVSQNDEPCSVTIQSLAPEVVETSPELVSPGMIKGGNDVSKVDPIDSSRSSASFVKKSSFPSETSSISSTSEGNRCDTANNENSMVDYPSDLVNSGTSPQVFVDSQTGKELPVADNDVQTNSTVACFKGLANAGSDRESCDGSSLTGKVLPCSAGMGIKLSPDMPSKVCSPSTVDEIHLKDTLDDETNGIALAYAVVEVDSQSSVADVDSQNSVDEIANEHSSACGTDADVSFSESHEDTLENGMSMPAEVDSHLTSDFNSGGDELVGDVLPTCSKCDENLSQLDNTVKEIVPKEELAVSDNRADTSNGDDNHAVSLSSTSLVGSLPWISTNTYPSSSETGEICHDTVVESSGTLPAENNPDSEKKFQKSPLEMTSEGSVTALEKSDLVSPVTSLDQRDRDTETESPCKNILVDSCIDSSAVNDLNILERVTIEQSSKAQTPCVSHAFSDEDLMQSSVSGDMEFVPQSEGSEFAPQPAVIELNSPKQELNIDPTFPSFGLIPETNPPNPEDMPPLPPMQWRIGKASHFSFPTFMGESVESSSSAPSSTPPTGSSLKVQIEPKPSEQSISLGRDISEQPSGEFVNNASKNPLQSSIEFPTIDTDLNSQCDNFDSQRTQSVNLSAKLPTMPSPGSIEDFGSEVNNLLAENAAQNHELVYSQESSLPKYEGFKDDADVHVSQGSEALMQTQSIKEEEKSHSVPDASNAETSEPSSSSVQKIAVGDAMWPVRSFTVAPTLDANKLEEVPIVRLPRPRSPLVDAVAAHDRRTMKKVSERIQPPIKPKQDDKDSLLAQIRNKSVSLKPAVATRPSIQTGPKTNLRVAAILEKANTIRQAMVGSDEDEDSDGWSDS